MSDSLLVEKCRQHDQKAQMQLYKQYCDGMFIVAYRYLNDQAAAEDALQEAFLKAFRKIDQFKGDVTFGAWLKKIVVNRCLDVLKARKLEVQSLEEKVLHIADDESELQVEDQVNSEEIYQAILRLPEKFKVVVQLFLIEGYDHQEISQILGITESASRTNLHRGKTLLKEYLKHLEYGTGY